MIKYITLLTIIFLSSCTNLSHSQLAGDVTVNVQANLNAQVTVGEQINGEGSETLLFWFLRFPGTRYRASGSTTSMTSNNPAVQSVPIISSFNMFNPLNIVENAKGEALYDAMSTTNADIIINPKYEIIETDYFFYKTVKCKVTGLKGTIKKVQ